MRNIASTAILLATALTAPLPASAQTCTAVPARQLSQTTAAEAGYLVLKRFESDKNPFLIQEDCLILDKNFWPKGQRSLFLHLGLVNHIPTAEAGDVAYLGVQAARRRQSDLIKVSRQRDWVRETDKGPEKLAAVKEKATGLTIAEWGKLHADRTAGVGVADQQMRAKWHGQPAEGAQSSWDANTEWATPPSFPEGTFLTNLLLRFDANPDGNRISIVPFSFGLPEQTEELVISVHSSIDAIRKTVRFRISK
jgi:hypothetical protein